MLSLDLDKIVYSTKRKFKRQLKKKKTGLLQVKLYMHFYGGFVIAKEMLTELGF